MKTSVQILIGVILIAKSCFAQGDSLYVNGRFLYNNHNEQIILKGINYSVVDNWGFPANMNTGSERTSQIALAKANTVRIQWYNTYPNAARPSYALSDLDSVMTRCARNGMIPIPELHDVTCTNNYTNFTNNIVNWWTQPSVVALINKHKRYSIVNLCNEFGYYQWTGSPAAALVTYKNNYKTAITALRNAGIKVPIMIDAPDCGSDADALISAGLELVNHDPLKNIMLSVHTYWQGYLGNNVANMNAKLTQMEASGLPFVLGEIANYQSDATACQYLLNYQDILTTATAKNIGWLAWTWTNDYCSSRQMSSDGTFANLGTYGLDIVNNATYGLANTAVKSALTFQAPPISLALPIVQLAAICNGSTFTLQTKINANFNGFLTVQYFNNNAWQVLSSENLNVVNNKNIEKIIGVNLGLKYRVVLKTNNRQLFFSNEISCHTINNDFSFFPNPAKDVIQLINNRFAQVIISDINGKQLFKNNIYNNKINISFLPKGIYIFKFITASNEQVVNKIIKL